MDSSSFITGITNDTSGGRLEGTETCRSMGVGEPYWVVGGGVSEGLEAS